MTLRVLRVMEASVIVMLLRKRGYVLSIENPSVGIICRSPFSLKGGFSQGWFAAVLCWQFEVPLDLIEKLMRM